MVVKRSVTKDGALGSSAIHTFMVSQEGIAEVNVRRGSATSAGSTWSGSWIDMISGSMQFGNEPERSTDSSRFPDIVKYRHRFIKGRRGESRDRTRPDDCDTSRWTSKVSGYDWRAQSMAFACEQAIVQRSSRKRYCQTLGDDWIVQMRMDHRGAGSVYLNDLTPEM